MKPDLLFVAHRIPYPPDKGEKIRGYHVLRHLAERYRVHLGCLVDDPADMAHVPALEQYCASVGAFQIDKRWQKVKALATLRPGRPLMLDYYRHAGLHRWVRDAMARVPMDIAYIFTVAMAPYVPPRPRTVLDALDIDSEKWAAYAGHARWPMRAVWRREGRTLLAYEREAAMRVDHTLFVSAQERDRFLALAPETAGRVHAVEIGVDLQRYSPDLPFDTPFRTPGPHIVFTGNMDYWPNSDAVRWFAAEVLPLLRQSHSSAEFHVVGANPGQEVLALATLAGVSVTGRVLDTRPYVAHADACVAPLNIGRGVQTKVLEAMAMGRPVVASPPAFEGIRAVPGRDLLVADGATATSAALAAVLAGSHPGLGASARAAMVEGYAWSAVLRPLDAILDSIPAGDIVKVLG